LRIWIDADACPGPIRDIVLRAAIKLSIPIVFVANKLLTLPNSPTVSFVHVEQGPDVVDAYIVAHSEAGDLVVTQDIPLAADLVHRDVTVLSPRGDSFNSDNIGDRLASRNLLHDLRDTGEITGGPRPFDDKTKRLFANLFDAELQRLIRHERKRAQRDALSD
jgi:uncharacterized protein